MLHFHLVTLFPKSIESYLKSSIIGRAQKEKKIKVSFYDPKKFTRNKHRRVDRRPYGGGPGMVLEPDAVLRAATAALKSKRRRLLDFSVVFFATNGKQFDEEMAKKFSRKKDILLICGHYEGVDERVFKVLSAKGGSVFGGKAKKVSMGPYVLTGGELPAAVLIDAVSRFVPDVLGKAESLERSRVSSPEVYTRPEVFAWKNKKYRVPKVLLTGHHAKIDEWKQKKLK
ncbi:tRNA (guanosine(37)-N1)-methyltransferase TrmD [Candidatus Kaiserbacteria bacterium RIFCSPHIGHO2_01_FULL_50_13]|uniref:tRNA (guanine-N(1)-)-methyltransferase n=1 Tax=Candidatus Kaiserbacteria bacterium RIFCSPLOWO2_01_FULL_50_24 TaxID=1798507 RepID=A0A1F6EMJ2_9BACT|nr:MAG: tRNA (guanosine(37)-N1)-methyltransferase TrmD [Candidatus Kaiserbacteria bacterium RIFCSPHIGHO2_01_FULL_50_13]OGG74861.1 MAG: tRNA (guanosine(37)-N1)-methyltransferase TrmD [Candidatus Kaiserbacteria bacterium RIFCSPLOWO2_01_FULL_50_24]OGG81427.1 MAG: tRNA (guanosine(37)-N1)-methyltransferase TrmD [Candidatus Kaiserbacteria bacterium RIFCSPLOWO2_02_FULL_51_13]